MTFNRPLSEASPPLETSDNQALSKQNVCTVCGDHARNRYYGALSCQSCKTFFRRNGFYPKIVRVCRFNGQCQINHSTRHMCTACRLQKCYSAGMCSDLIRKPIISNRNHLSKNRVSALYIVDQKSPAPVPQLPTLDLLRHDRSCLSISQWTTMSNVIHAFDTYSIIPRVNQLLKIFSSSTVNVRLSTVDVMDIVRSLYTSMQSFVSSTPDFQILTINEQRSLLARNLQGVSGFSFHILARDTGIVSHPKCHESYRSIYGSVIIKQLYHLMSELDTDSTLLKLMLLIIGFSSNSFVVDGSDDMHNDSLILGTFRLLGSQNAYVEILWKYMLYRYGYIETVMRFSRMVQYMLDDLKYTAMMYMNNDAHHDLIDEVTEKSTETLLSTQNEVVPLWGKTLMAVQ